MNLINRLAHYCYNSIISINPQNLITTIANNALHTPLLWSIGLSKERFKRLPEELQNVIKANFDAIPFQVKILRPSPEWYLSPFLSSKFGKVILASLEGLNPEETGDFFEAVWQIVHGSKEGRKEANETLVFYLSRGMKRLDGSDPRLPKRLPLLLMGEMASFFCAEWYEKSREERLLLAKGAVTHFPTICRLIMSEKAILAVLARMGFANHHLVLILQSIKLYKMYADPFLLEWVDPNRTPLLHSFAFSSFCLFLLAEGKQTVIDLMVDHNYPDLVDHCLNYFEEEGPASAERFAQALRQQISSGAAAPDLIPLFTFLLKNRHWPSCVTTPFQKDLKLVAAALLNGLSDRSPSWHETIIEICKSESVRPRDIKEFGKLVELLAQEVEQPARSALLAILRVCAERVDHDEIKRIERVERAIRFCIEETERATRNDFVSLEADALLLLSHAIILQALQDEAIGDLNALFPGQYHALKSADGLFHALPQPDIAAILKREGLAGDVKPFVDALDQAALAFTHTSMSRFILMALENIPEKEEDRLELEKEMADFKKLFNVKGNNANFE